MDDLISRQATMKEQEINLRDCNPEHFRGHEKFIPFMDDPDIGSFGSWQFANGFNMGITAGEVVVKNMQTIDAVEVVRCKDCEHYKGHWYCEAWNNSPGFPAVEENGYCYLAERRDDAAD